MANSNLGENTVYFSLQFIHCHEGKSEQELKVGCGTEIMEERYILVCSQGFYSTAFLRLPRTI